MKKKHRNTNGLRNYTQKMKFLDRINDQDGVPTDDELLLIQRLCHDKNTIVRSSVAIALVQRYDPGSEKILLDMTYDKNSLVRIEAVDTLCIGRCTCTLERLKELFQDPNYMIRGYAVVSYFNVWINCYGYTKESMRDYIKDTESFRNKETNPWVLLSYDRNRFLAGEKEGVENLIHILSLTKNHDEVFDGNLYFVKIASSAVNTLREIRTIWNEEWINRILKDALEYIPPWRGLISDITSIVEKQEFPQILLLDRTNSQMSQFLEFIGNQKYQFDFYSAGLTPEKNIQQWVIDDIEKEYDVDVKKYQYTKQLEFLCDYQFIVPLGIKIEDEQYPFQKIIRRYEDMPEGRLTIEQGEKLVDEIVAEICKVCAGKGICFERKSILIED